MKIKLLYVLPFLALLLVFPSCKDDDAGGNLCDSDFDQVALFTNVADHIILPGYQALQEKVNALKASIESFSGDPTVANLEVAQNAWVEAELAWQQVAQFEFGPAEENLLRSSVNNFPLDREAVDENITTEDYDLDQFDTFDKGFPALDYLLFGLGSTNAEIAATYSDASTGHKYKNYIADVILDIQQRVDATYAGWTGDYRETFVSNTGTAAGTSLSLLINNLNQYYEIIKREKIGIPSGELTLGFPNPDKVEAYYSGRSLELAVVALQANRDLFLGTGTNGVDGTGLDDYLLEVDARKSSTNELLATVIEQQYQAALNGLEGLTPPLSVAVESETAAVQSAYRELSDQLVNIKTDMPSVLCVSITYIDNPSDSD